MDVEIQEGIAIISLNNPPSNFLTRGLVREFSHLLQNLSADSVRAVIVTGKGRVFSAGVDPREIAQFESDAEAKRTGAAAQEFLSAVGSLSKPVIAAINGLCLGGGLELAMACHFRFCSERARLGLPEITLGLVPACGGTQRLPRLVGVPMALHLILTGDTVKAEVAKAIGLVDRVVPHREVLKSALKYARRFLRRDPVAVAAALKSVLQGTNVGLENGLKGEIEALGRLFQHAGRTKGGRPLPDPRSAVD